MTRFGAWQFDFSQPITMIAAALLLVSFLLTVRSVSQRLFKRNQSRALLTILLNGLAYSMVLLLLFEPRFRHPAEDSVFLLTEGADTGSLSIPANTHVYTLATANHVTPSEQLAADALTLLDAGQLILREPAVSKIELRGYGLDQLQWLSLKHDIQIEFEPPPVHGVTNIKWPRTLARGETLKVSGTYQHSDETAVIQLLLLDPAGNTVAETRTVNGQSFSLITRAKTQGHLKYQLQAWLGGVLLSEENVAVTVHSSPVLRIMIEQSSPSYETLQLKNYAAADGHHILINTAISKDKSIRQTANLPVGSDTAFSSQNLDKQDLLIMDGRSVSRLNRTRLHTLTKAVENGLGLLILADSVLLENFSRLRTGLLDGFDLRADSESETLVASRLLEQPLQVWPVELTVRAMQLKTNGGSVLIDDTRGRALVATLLTGLGNISISLVAHSYRLLTSGNRAIWSELWSSTIKSLARQPQGGVLLAQADSDFFRARQRVPICALTTDSRALVSVSFAATEGQLSRLELELAKDPLNSAKQCAYFWPQSHGWHQLSLVTDTDGSVLDQSALYIYRDSQWQAQYRNERIMASRSRADYTRKNNPDKTKKWADEPVSKLWIWVLLILTATLLWLERKFDFS